MYKLVITSFYLFISAHLFSQTELGAEYQHGFGKSYNINSFGALYEGFNYTGSSWQIGLSYSFDALIGDKKSSGRNGLGLSLGYRYGFSYGTSGNLIGGVRTTFNFGKDVEQKKHTVFTPSIEFGYHLTFNNFGKGGFTTPSIAFGYDIPLTQGDAGKDDHEGALFIPRIAVGYRF